MARCKDWGTPHEHAHGTTSGWAYHGCRCVECEAVHYAYHRAADKERYGPARLARNRAYFRRRRAEDPEWAQLSHGGVDKARATERARRYRQSNPDLVRTSQARLLAKAPDRLGATSATRWTPSEDAIISRSDLTLVEMATMTRRSYSAVSQRRHKLSSSQ